MVLEITDENFESILLKNDKPLVIDFWAPRCAPCKTIGPTIEVLSEEYDGQVLIGKIDVDSNPKLSSKFGIRNIPTIVYLKNGEVINKQIGSTTKAILEDKLKTIL